jgi:medium-chain acyl-[acyl-carrier-protein] hydrolase
MSKIKLLCFPYAGGSAAIFSKWKRYLDPSIELLPVELAGRGSRMHEPFYENVTEAVDDVFQLICNDIRNAPYALFGHSMGCLISYELTKKIKLYNLPLPEHVFFSGRGAPHIKRPDEKKYHLMGDVEFRKEVINLGGTPREFFEHPDLMQLFLPVLKNDFRLAEEEREEEKPVPLDTDITVFLGKDDDLTAVQCDGWKVLTRQLCSLYYFEGGHFFIHEQTRNLVGLINHTLLGSSHTQYGSQKVIID